MIGGNLNIWALQPDGNRWLVVTMVAINADAVWAAAAMFAFLYRDESLVWFCEESRS